MPITTNGFPYPAGTDAADVPHWLQLLAEKCDEKTAGGTASMVRATKTVAQSIANDVYTAVTFNAEDYDIGGLHDTGVNPSRLTAPATGYWQVNAQVSFAQNTVGYRKFYMAKNGTTQIAASAAAVSTGTSTALVAWATVFLNAGEYVEIFATQTSGAALNIAANTGETFAEMRQVRS